MPGQAKKEIIPLYSRVATTMQGKIVSGQYGPGERLPTEDDLVQYYGVSKITIRNALALLESDGLITRNRGKGTFVADHVPQTRQMIHTSLNETVMAIEKGQVKPLEIKDIHVCESRIPNDIRSFFNLNSDDPINRIRRLVTQDNILSFFENYMPLDIAKHITKTELSKKKSIQKILKEKIGLKVTQGDLYLQAVVAEQDISEILNCQAFEPLIHLQAYFWSAPGQPFEIVNRYIRACNFKYKMDVKVS